METSKTILAILCILLFSCKKELNTPLPEKKTESSTPKITMVPQKGVLEEIKFENGKSIKLYRIDTTYLIDGDILFTPRQVSTLKQLNSGASVRTFINDFLKYWPSGRVPFVIILY